jgi:hypothetical protein
LWFCLIFGILGQNPGMNRRLEGVDGSSPLHDYVLIHPQSKFNENYSRRGIRVPASITDDRYYMTQKYDPNMEMMYYNDNQM